MPKNKIKYSILRNGEFGCGSMFDLLPIKDVEECKIAANKFTSTYDPAGYVGHYNFDNDIHYCNLTKEGGNRYTYFNS